MEAMKFLEIEMEEESAAGKGELSSIEGAKYSGDENSEGNLVQDEELKMKEECPGVLEVYIKQESQECEDGFPNEGLNTQVEDVADYSQNIEDQLKNLSSGGYPDLEEDLERSRDNGELNISLNKILSLYLEPCFQPRHFLNRVVTGVKGYFVCSKCSFEAGSEGELKNHILTHYDIGPGVMEERGGRGMGIGSGSGRRKSEEEEDEEDGDRKTYSCSVCDFRTCYRSNLQKHTLIHSDTKKFRCPECSYQTNFKDSLKKHSMTHTDVKLFKCDLCEYETSIKGHLKRHSLTHSATKRFKCDECDYATNHKVHLKTHILNHKGFLYKCPQCHYGTNVKGSLKRHFLTHNENKLYRCEEEECTYQTNRQSYLKAHVLTHSGMKLFKCHLCPYETNQKVHLNAHVLKHSGLKVFKCHLCPYETNYKHGLKRHLNSHHKEHVQND